MTSDLRIGIAGLGWPGERHAEAIAATAGVRLAAACDLDPERRERFAARFAPPRTCADPDELVADPGIDALIVALPNHLHAPVTLAALRAGKHVLCEKPPAISVGEMLAVRDEAARRRRTFFFGRQSRFDPLVQAAKQTVAAGRLGRVYFAKSTYVRSRGVPVGAGAWFTDPARAGGGVVIDLGVHALDTAWYLMGCPPPRSLSAQVGRHFSGGGAPAAPPGHGKAPTQAPVHHRPAAVAPVEAEDVGFAFVRFADGCALQLEVCWAGHLPGEVPPSDWTGHELIDTVLYGDRASLQLEPPTLCWVDDQKRAHREALLPEAGPAARVDQARSFGPQLAAFAHAVRTGERPENDPDQAVQLTRMLLAVYESSASGREVRFDDL